MAVHGRGQVVGGGAVPEVGVHDDPEALKLLEVPVDGREVDVGGLGLHLGGEFLGAAVPG